MTLIYFKGDKLAAYEGREDDLLKTNPKYRFMNLLDVLDRMCIKNNFILVLFGMYLQDEFHRAETINDQKLVRKMIARFIVQLSVETDVEKNCEDIYVSSVVAVRFNEFVSTLSKITFYDSILAAGYAIDDPDYKDEDEDDEPDKDDEDEEQETDALDKVRYNVHGQFEGYREIAKVLLDKFEVEAVDMKLDEVMSNPHFSEILHYVLLVRGINGDRVSMYKFNCYFNTRTHVTGGYELLKI